MIQIAIDGPSGAGKSTVAKIIAARIGIVYVDTGALYRTVGYYVRSRSVDPTDAASVTALLPEIRVDLEYTDGVQHVLLNRVDLGDAIRTNEIARYASAVSAIPAVRAFLLDTQRKIASEHSVIMDGRDIGSVILPNADVKIFLTANDETRAARRCQELKQKGIETTLEKVLAEMRERDRNDATREVAPAVPAPDAILFDNSGLDAEGTADGILAIIREKAGDRL